MFCLKSNGLKCKLDCFELVYQKSTSLFSLASKKKSVW